MEFEKRQRAPIGPRKDFAIEDGPAAELDGGGCDFRECLRDALEVPRENLGARTVAVDLGPDAIELRLDPQVPSPEARRNGFGIGLGNGEHALEGLENPERAFSQTAGFGKHRHAGEVAFQHIRIADLGGVGTERLRERLLEQTFLEPDAEVAGEDFHKELRGQWGNAAEKPFEEFRFCHGTAGGTEFAEEGIHFRQGRVPAASSPGHHLLGGEARIIQPPRNRAVFAFGHAGGFDQCGADHRPPGLVGGGIGGGESMACEPNRHAGQVVGGEFLEIGGEQLGFRFFPGERCDAFADGTKLQEAGVGIRVGCGCGFLGDGWNRYGKFQLVRARQCPRLDSAGAQVGGEFRGEPMERKDPRRGDIFDMAEEVVVAGVVGKRECRIAAQAVHGAGVHRPTRHRRHAPRRDGRHGAAARGRGRANDNMTLRPRRVPFRKIRE